MENKRRKVSFVFDKNGFWSNVTDAPVKQVQQEDFLFGWEWLRKCCGVLQKTCVFCGFTSTGNVLMALEESLGSSQTAQLGCCRFVRHQELGVNIRWAIVAQIVTGFDELISGSQRKE